MKFKRLILKLETKKIKADIMLLMIYYTHNLGSKSF